MASFTKAEQQARRAACDAWTAEDAASWADGLVTGEIGLERLRERLSGGWSGRWLELLIADLAERARTPE
jgi:hypothetical protein